MNAPQERVGGNNFRVEVFNAGAIYSARQGLLAEMEKSNGGITQLSLPLSATILDGRYMLKEDTDLTVVIDPQGKGYSMRSRIALVGVEIFEDHETSARVYTLQQHLREAGNVVISMPSGHGEDLVFGKSSAINMRAILDSGKGYTDEVTAQLNTRGVNYYPWTFEVEDEAQFTEVIQKYAVLYESLVKALYAEKGIRPPRTQITLKS